MLPEGPLPGDAFGLGLLQYLERGRADEIVERDDGFVDTLDIGVYFSKEAQWPEAERRALELSRGRVLDIGAGAGRHSLHLQERGLKVTAIDTSPGAVEVCKRRGIKDVRLLGIEDAHALAPLRFDTIVLFGHNLGLLGGREEGKERLKKLHALADPGALLLGSTRDPYDTRTNDHLAYHQRNRERGRMAGQLKIRVRTGRIATPWFDYLFTSMPELEQIAEGTGWKVREYLDDREGSYVAAMERL